MDFRRILKILGPGLLFASMSIGTSHLVLSTKAGAQYGWLMVIPILLANVLKYPFFEFGVRYTAVTQNTLIQGYKFLGKKYLWLYAFITLISTFTILAALYTVTAGLLINLFDFQDISINFVALLLFGFISAILIIGRYKFLEISLKFIVSILFVALLITTVVVFVKGQVTPVEGFVSPEFFDEVGILFIIGLIGWMPTAVEASGWVSVWTVEKSKSMKDGPSYKEAKQEFDLGYVITALLAVFFLIIGVMTLYGTGRELSSSSVQFADQIVSLFTEHIGNWGYTIIAIAAFSTMFSTCMTAHDAVSRVSLDILDKLKESDSNQFKSKRAYGLTIVVMTLVNWLVIVAFGGHMGNLVALATFVSFVFAPILGWMNLKTVNSQRFPIENRPNKAIKLLTYLGIVFLSVFALYYLFLVVIA
ncbi:NRAMP family divalent metal transporter [Croceivirga thetidis]